MDFGVGEKIMKIELQDENDCIYSYLYNEQVNGKIDEGKKLFNDKVFRCKLFGLCLGRCEKYIKESESYD